MSRQVRRDDVLTIDENGHVRRSGKVPREFIRTVYGASRHVFVSQKMIKLPLDCGANSLGAQGLFNSRASDPCVLCGKAWDDPRGSAHDIGPGWPEASNAARLALHLEVDFEYEIMIRIVAHEVANPDMPSLSHHSLAAELAAHAIREAHVQVTAVQSRMTRRSDTQ